MSLRLTSIPRRPGLRMISNDGKLRSRSRFRRCDRRVCLSRNGCRSFSRVRGDSVSVGAGVDEHSTGRARGGAGIQDSASSGAREISSVSSAFSYCFVRDVVRFLRESCRWRYDQVGIMDPQRRRSEFRELESFDFKEGRVASWRGGGAISVFPTQVEADHDYVFGDDLFGNFGSELSARGCGCAGRLRRALRVLWTATYLRVRTTFSRGVSS